MSVMILTAFGIAAILLVVAILNRGEDVAAYAAIWAICIVFGIVCIEIHMEWLPLVIAAIIGFLGWWQGK